MLYSGVTSSVSSVIVQSCNVCKSICALDLLHKSPKFHPNFRNFYDKQMYHWFWPIMSWLCMMNANIECVYDFLVVYPIYVSLLDAFGACILCVSWLCIPSVSWLQALHTSELSDVGTLLRPDFMQNPHKYFSERPSSGAQASRLPALAESRSNSAILCPYPP